MSLSGVDSGDDGLHGHEQVQMVGDERGEPIPGVEGRCLFVVGVAHDYFDTYVASHRSDAPDGVAEQVPSKALALRPFVNAETSEKNSWHGVPGRSLAMNRRRVIEIELVGPE
ncbi:hypothetical protein [Propionibacterium australiense]|uniref:hypothetical protein n=1 Tax=Propionibacterium australiense TaxID=119981 RepID=UPI001E370CD1|nr:hypothetical protein [Propionibacterium australiense]